MDYPGDQRNAVALFLLPLQPRTLHVAWREPNSPQTVIRHNVRPCRRAAVVCDGHGGWKSRSSSALHHEDSANRYVDLRSMKVIRPSQAHVCPCAAPDTKFGIVDDPQIFHDVKKGESLRNLLFNEDTFPLSDAQKQAVQALLSRRSVIYAAVAGEERIGIFMDMVLRNRVWKDCIVFCSSSRAAAESMYAILCAQLGPERRSEVCLDFGDGDVYVNGAGAHFHDGIRVIITLQHVLRNTLVVSDTRGWISNVSVVFIDNFSVSALADWEEVLLAMPSRILMCLFMKELSLYEQELLPLWLETIQNNFVLVAPSGASSVLDRIERPQNFPLLRMFAYNAATHKSPVQVSLNLLKEMLQKERDSVGYDFVPTYSECFLQGVTTIPAEEPASLEFQSAEEAEYADISSLVLADAKRTEEKVRNRSKRRARATKRKERTASSRAAARRRRDAAYTESLLLPAIILVNGQRESEISALSIQSALIDETNLLWDDDTQEHVEDIVTEFKNRHADEIGDENFDVLELLKEGIGVIHNGCIPSIRILTEQLFRGGLIPVLVADTHLGSQELLLLPCAKSIIIESSAFALCDDKVKGFIKASTAVALAGRMGKDDVGNLIVTWYDDSIDDEAAGSEIASTLLEALFSDSSSGVVDGLSSFSVAREEVSPTYQEHNFNISPIERRANFTPLASSYDGLLRSLQRFGVDGYGAILDYTVQTFRGWLERAALQATREKLSLEKKELDDHLEAQDWSAIAEYERTASKRNEATRILKAMEQKFSSVVSERIREELQVSAPGKIIGLECSGSMSQPWEQKLLEGTGMPRGDEGDEVQDATKHYPVEHGGFTKSSLGKKIESLSAAVFVAVRDQERDGHHVKAIENRWLVVCILADGMWTMVPISDVVAISDAEGDIIPNVDILMTPHSATFDVDPNSNWAKCFPVDENEKASLHRISDELIGKVASANRPALERYQIPEFEAQKARADKAEKLFQESAWFDRDEELAELRRMRRRAAVLGDEIEALRKKETRIEDNLFNHLNAQTTNQSSIMAVLEDCHALSILGNGSTEMTPIGVLASVLPGGYPLFSAACLSLIDDVLSLSAAEFAAYVALVICSGQKRTYEIFFDPERRKRGDKENLDEELDMSILTDEPGTERQNGSLDGRKLTILEGLHDVLPGHVVSMINDILQALRQLHMRHLNERSKLSTVPVMDIVPRSLNIRLAKAVRLFASGANWCDVAKNLKHENGYMVDEMRQVKSVLAIIADENGDGEFGDATRQLALEAYNFLNRWPLRDCNTVIGLVDEGIVERIWNGNTYDKWWRGTRDRLEELVGKGEEVESAEAEILES